MDKQNDRRLVRIVGVYRETGKPFSSYINKEKPSRPFTPIYINLDRPRQELYNRINSRVHQMIDLGLIEEVESLTNYRDQRALDSVGYKEVFGYLDGEFDLESTIEQIQRNSRRYAKRQMTWFRNQINATNFHPLQIDEIKNHLNGFLRS